MSMLLNHRMSPTRGRRPASVWQILEDWLEPEVHFSNAERIRRMREAYFAYVEELRKSGKVKLPE